MSRFYKRLSALLALVVATSSFGVVNAAVEPDKTAIIAQNDFEGTELPNSGNQDIYVTNAYPVFDEEHGRVAQNDTFAGNDVMGENGRLSFGSGVFDTKPDAYIVEFDIKLLQNHPFRYFIHGENGYIGYILFAKNEKIAFMKSASLPGVDLTPTAETSSFGIADYAVNEWSTISIKVDTVEKTLTYYANGEYICGAEFDGQDSGYIKFLLSQSNKVSEASPYIRIDNPKVYEFGHGTFYAVASTDGEMVEVNFSEWTDQNTLEDIEIWNTETEETVAAEVYELSGKKVVFSLEENLKSGTEYCVVLPDDIKSFSGLDMYSQNIYFMAPVVGGIEKVVFDDGFDTYSASGEQVNFPEGWTAHKQASFNHLDFHSDDSHEKAVHVWNTGWTRSIFTKNFGKKLGGEIQISFDFKPTDFNKYIAGEEDPNFLSAVTSSVTKMIGSATSYDVLNRNFTLYFAPTAEDNQTRTKEDGTVLRTINNADLSYVSGNTLKFPTTFFGLYGDRLGFCSMSLPAEGNYVNVTKDNWYHVELSLDMDNLKATGKIDDIDIGEYNLPSNMRDAQYGAVIERIMFVVEPHAHYGLSGGKVTYTDSVSNEEKTFTRTNDSRFALDNVKVSYSAPEFKVEKVRLYDVDAEDFGPLQTTTSYLNKVDIKFSEEIDLNSVDENTVRIISDGVDCDYSIIGYDEEESLLELELEEFPVKGEACVIVVDGVETPNQDKVSTYTSTVYVTTDGVFRYDLTTITDSAGEVLPGSVSGGTKIYAQGHILNTGDDDKIVNLFIAGYKETENGEEISGIESKTLVADVSSYTEFGATEDECVSVILDSAADYIKIYADEEKNYETSDKELSAGQTGDYTVRISGNAAPGELVKLDIPISATEYKSDKACEMFYRNTEEADADGKYEFVISASGKTSGEYTAYLYNMDAEYVIQKSFVYADPDDITDAIGELENPDSEMTTEEVLDEYRYALGIDSELYKNGSSKQCADILDEYMKDNALPTNAKDVSKLFNRIYLISAIDKGAYKNLFDYSEEACLDESSIKAFYDAEFVSTEVEKDITEALKGKDFSSIETFEKELLKQFVLKVVEKPDGYGNAKTVIEYYSDEIGITKKYKDSAYRKTAGHAYNGYSVLIAELDKNNKEEDRGGSHGGSGGGFGGAMSGNESGVSGSVISGGNIVTGAEKGEMPYDIFTDIGDVPWAKPAIVYLAEKGIVNGTSEKKFSPNDNIKREEIVKIVVNAFAKEAQASVISFNDVEFGEWYHPYITKAVGAGIAKGYSDVLFGVGDNVTRQDMAVMIYNAAISAGYTFTNTDTKVFEDDAEIADYAKDAVYKLKSEGIINGMDTENFAPNEPATRAQAAKIIYGLLKL